MRSQGHENEVTKKVMAQLALIHPKCHKRRRFGVTIEDRVDMFHDVDAEFEELSFVLYRNQSLLSSVSACELKRLG